MRYLIVLIAVWSAASWAQTDVVEVTTKTMRYGDWQVRCEQRNSTAESCVMSLKIVAKDSGTELVQANFAKQEQGTLMTLILPLGIYLPTGVLLDIKDHQKFGFPITFCTRDGCFVNEVVSEETVNLLRKKEQATITIAPVAGQTVELPFSINGFLDAYKKL